jgi:hypothetical protein
MIVETNALVTGMHGKLGKNLILRTVRGKIIASQRNDKPQVQSALQKGTRDKFRLASAYAKSMMLIPEKKAYYLHKAKKLKLPNAYTAALTHFLRKGEVQGIDTRKYKGRSGDTIIINTYKKQFTVNKVRLVMLDINGVALSSQICNRKAGNQFIYNAEKDIPIEAVAVIKVVIEDNASYPIARDFDLLQNAAS